MRKLVFISVLSVLWSFAVKAQLPGSLDFTFGSFGKSILTLPGFTTEITAIRSGYDGKLYACGNSYTFETGMGFLARYTTDGQPDNTFQGGSSHYIQFKINNSDTYLTDLVLRADGRILVIGYVIVSSQPHPALARFMPDGTPDVSFGFGGQLVLNQFDATPTGVVMLDNNRFAVVGDISLINGSDLIVMRFLSNGELDVSFASSGFTTIDLNNSSQDFGGSITWNYNDGKMLVSGTAEKIGSMADGVALVRLNSNGTLDASFGSNGIALFDGFETNNTITVDRSARHIRHLDGKIWVSAKYLGIDKTLGMIVRFLDNGQIDQSFGDYGMRLYEWGDYSHRRFTDLFPQYDGKVLISGYVTSSGESSTLFGRLLPNGDPDPSVGNGKGYTIHSFSTGSPQIDKAYRIILQSLEKAVMGGMVLTTDGSSGILSRYYLGNTVGLLEYNHPHNLYAWVTSRRLVHLSLGSHIRENRFEGLKLFNASGIQVAEYPKVLSSHAETIITIELPYELCPGLYLIKLEGLHPEGVKVLVE